jgi:hypothetical protein
MLVVCCCVVYKAGVKVRSEINKTVKMLTPKKTHYYVLRTYTKESYGLKCHVLLQGLQKRLPAIAG